MSHNLLQYPITSMAGKIRNTTICIDLLNQSVKKPNKIVRFISNDVPSRTRTGDPMIKSHRATNYSRPISGGKLALLYRSDPCSDPCNASLLDSFYRICDKIICKICSALCKA